MNCTSANYFGDLVKDGKNSQEHIHIKLVDKAKELLCATNKSVSEIAYELGSSIPIT
ncbi:MAG: helix-turn-helix domain-containing protein [Akkermansia sp.]